MRFGAGWLAGPVRMPGTCGSWLPIKRSKAGRSKTVDAPSRNTIGWRYHETVSNWSSRKVDAGGGRRRVRDHRSYQEGGKDGLRERRGGVV